MRRLKAVALASLLLAAPLTACAQEATQPAAEQWTPPAWFAEQARAREQARSAMQACVEAKGWAVTADEWGGAEEPFDDEATAEQYQRDSQECQTDLGIGPGAVKPDEEYWQGAYQRALDTWNCIRNEGIDLSDPPSEATYVEQRMAEAPDQVWLPYGDPEIAHLMESGEMTSEERESLEVTCPQSWN